MKMQVDFDSTYSKENNEAQRKIRQRSKMIAAHKVAIGDIVMEDLNDYEALTSVYRKIFRFLVEFAPNSKYSDKDVESEIAAALESVFPRVGLKAFISLNSEDKGNQLMELARIILGIRLFNREEQRGGAGIDQMDKDCSRLAQVLNQDINQEVDFFTDACNKYQKAIIKAHNAQRKTIRDAEDAEKLEARKKTKLDADSRAGEKESTIAPPDKKEFTLKVHNPNEVTDFMIDRWSTELANRRQYLGFLKTLQEESKMKLRQINDICEKLTLELQNVKALVTNKNAVAKEVIYPRFDSLGTVWLNLYEEVVVLIARSNTFQTLCKYRLSFIPTLGETHYQDGILKEVSLVGPDTTIPNHVPTAESKDSFDHGRINGRTESKDQLSRPDSQGSSDHKEHKQRSGQSDDIPETAASGATLLSVNNTPDFMLLPLELQGYCPWTIVRARGLLIPGRPVFGIVRYMNLYYVCDHEIAIRNFMEDPDYFLHEIRNRALRSPEYIHLLRLQRWFPTASIAKLLRLHEMETQNKSGVPLTRDASTSTPTHFVESYIDVNYHWNQWELRRRALKMINLRNCQTSSQQTDLSHFRRDNDTQVHEATENATQTKRDKGTNPPIVTTYVTGFRGKLAPDDDADAKGIDGSVRKDSKQSKSIPRCGVTTLTLDL
jgi:hypothetical protein